LKGERRLERKERRRDKVGIAGESSCLYAATNDLDEGLNDFYSFAHAQRR